MGRTFDIAKDRAQRVEDSVLPQEIDIQVEHAPSAAALTLFTALNAVAGASMASLERQEITLAEVSDSKDRSRTRQHLKELTTCLIQHNDPKLQKETFGHLLDWVEIEYSDSRYVVAWRVGYAYANLLKNHSQFWSLLDLETVKKIRCKYGLYLYLELSKHWFKNYVSEIYLTTDELRHVLKVPNGKLTDNTNLIRRALNPAVAAVSEHTRYQVSYEEKRGGRGGKLLGVTLTWKQKPYEAAQRNDQGDTRHTGPAQAGKPGPRWTPFPDSGCIRDNAFWYGLAKEHCKSPLPDMTILADKFRKRARSEGAHLDGPRVEMLFRRFCEAWTPH